MTLDWSDYIWLTFFAVMFIIGVWPHKYDNY